MKEQVSALLADVEHYSIVLHWFCWVRVAGFREKRLQVIALLVVVVVFLMWCFLCVVLLLCVVLFPCFCLAAALLHWGDFCRRIVALPYLVLFLCYARCGNNVCIMDRLAFRYRYLARFVIGTWRSPSFSFCIFLTFVSSCVFLFAHTRSSSPGPCFLRNTLFSFPAWAQGLRFDVRPCCPGVCDAEEEESEGTSFCGGACRF